MTERLTKEAALAMARHIAARIADSDGATALAADIRGGFHDAATEVSAALEAICAIEDRHAAEIARLQRIADHAPGFEVPIIATLRAENAALKAKLAGRPTNTSERERVARAYVTHKGWDWYQAECDEDAGCCQCLSCYYQGSLTIPDVREAEMQAADAAIAAMDRPTISTDVVEALAAMVYETTSLSPMKTNGDHDCTIRSATFKAARAALRATHTITGGKDD